MTAVTNTRPPESCASTIGVDRYYTLIRSQIEHEDNLIGTRLSWLVAAQSFYFTAYAITVSNFGPTHPSWAIAQMHLLLTLLPVVAILTCVLIYATILAGLVAIGHLRRLYRDYADHAATGGLPPVQGYRRTQALGQAAPIFVPVVFLGAWIILFARGIH